MHPTRMTGLDSAESMTSSLEPWRRRLSSRLTRRQAPQVHPHCPDFVVGQEFRVRPRHHRTENSPIRTDAGAKRLCEIGLGPFPDSCWCEVRHFDALDGVSAGKVGVVTARASTRLQQIVTMLLPHADSDWGWPRPFMID